MTDKLKHNFDHTLHTQTNLDHLGQKIKNGSGKYLTFPYVKFHL